jgi:hypothetical protein
MSYVAPPDSRISPVRAIEWHNCCDIAIPAEYFGVVGCDPYIFASATPQLPKYGGAKQIIARRHTKKNQHVWRWAAPNSKPDPSHSRAQPFRGGNHRTQAWLPLSICDRRQNSF